MSIFDVIDSSTGKGSGNHFIIGRVKKIVLGQYETDKEVNLDYKSEKDVGKIFYEPLYQGKSNTKSKQLSKEAYPIFSFIRQFPVINEIVMIISGPSSNLNDGTDRQDSWYFPPFGIWNSVHSNPFPNLQEWAGYINDKISNQGIDKKLTQFLKVPQGKTFIEKSNIKNLRPFEGDVLLQGRWGQSVRFGSTISELKKVNPWSNSGPSGDPITIIKNSQKSLTPVESESPTAIEDINRDGSSIYLTSTQAIPVEDISRYKIRSYSFANAANPITDNVIIAEMPPLSNTIISAADQDRSSLK